jgi:hypothetical protein
MPQRGANIDEGLVQAFAPKKFSPDGPTCASRHLKCLVQSGHGFHVDLSQEDTVALAFDAQLRQIGADDGECGNLWNTGQCCPKLAQ